MEHESTRHTLVEHDGGLTRAERHENPRRSPYRTSTSTTMTAANAIRYTLKTATERVRSHDSRNPIASIPLMAATTKPATMAAHSLPAWVSVSSLREPYRPAPRVIGVASRKLKRAAASRVRPSARPAVMVAP